MDPWAKHFLEMADGKVPHTSVYRAPTAHSHQTPSTNPISTVKRKRTITKQKRVKKSIKRTKKAIKPSKSNKKKKKTSKSNGVGVRGGVRGKFSNFF